MQTGEGDKILTFPSQALPCSGSTGLISALSQSDSQHPGEEIVWFLQCKNNSEKPNKRVTFFYTYRLSLNLLNEAIYFTDITNYNRIFCQGTKRGV